MTTITDSGTDIIIEIDGKPTSYPKTGISTKLKPGSYFKILYELQEVLSVSDSQRAIVSPASSSLLDLWNKFFAMILQLGEVKYVASINDLTYPFARGFVISPSETLITDQPSLHLLFNDGSATVKEDLYVIPIQQIRDLA